MKSNADFAPIVIFTYNRPFLLKKTLEYLSLNYLSSKTTLYVFIDGPRNNQDLNSINEIKNNLNKITGFKKVITVYRKHNLGLKINLEKSITEIFELHEQAIFLEDDIITGKYFLSYMNQALDYYEKFNEICQVSGYSYLENILKENYNESIYFIKGGDCLAWGTWRNRWKTYNKNSYKLIKKVNEQNLSNELDRDNSYPYTRMLKQNIVTNKSWAINWYAINFIKNKYTVYPTKSLALHIGADVDATNYKNDKTRKDPLNVKLYLDKIDIKFKKPFENSTIESSYRTFLGLYNKSFKKKIKNKIKRLYKSLVKHKKFLSHNLRSILFNLNYDLDKLTFKSNIENKGFEKLLKSCNSYLEYGSGFSTVFAEKLKIEKIISIEGDYYFSKYVNSKVINCKMLYKDIGPISTFSDPYINFIFPLNKSRKIKFKSYSDFPSDHYEKNNLPTLILIHGKFRVACALKVLKYFIESEFDNWNIVVDDYIGRSQYNILEYFFKNINLNGEQAVFSEIGEFEVDFLNDTINKYELIID